MVVLVMGPEIAEQLMAFMRETFELQVRSNLTLDDAGSARAHLMQVGILTIKLGAPICVAGFLMSVLGSFIQAGPVFSTEPLQPDLNRINPLQGFQRIVSMRNMIDGLRMVVRGVILVALAYVLLKPKVIGAITHLFQEPDLILRHIADDARTLFYALGAVMFGFAGVDYWWQRREYMKGARLTKQEAKEEHREHEGDPLLKSRMRSLQKERARKRMMEAVKKADVVITNPTHIAVALSYHREKGEAPKVVAKGADFLAQKIKQLAADSGVPMVENVPLARTLFKTVKLGQVIPRSLYQAVAEVLAYVYRLKGKVQ